MSAAHSLDSAASRRKDADAELAMVAANEAASKALRAGARAPLFTLEDAAGQHVALEDLLREGPVVLHFFRGAWCTFGEQSLLEFASMHEKVVALGASAVAIAPAGNAAPPSQPLPMLELQDINMKVARAYGLAFDLPTALRPTYERLGYAPPSTRNASTWLVPLPATYLIDRDGIVALAFIDVDYRKRLEPESLLTALRALQTRRATRRAPHSVEPTASKASAPPRRP
jgi:peroxiredoxin